MPPESRFVIYAIRNRLNGNCYVGSTKDLKRRFEEHQRELCGDRHYAQHMQRAWNLYGKDAFEFVVLEWVANEAALLEREQHWIDELHPAYNSCPAARGPSGFRHRPESIEKMRQAQKGRVITPEMRARISATLTGRKLSPEHVANSAAGHRGQAAHPKTIAGARAWHTGRPQSEEARQKMSAAKRGMTWDREIVERRAAACRGKHRTEEQRRHSSEAQLRRYIGVDREARWQERFLSRIDQRGPDECWEWQGHVRPDGFAEFHADRTMTVQRIAYRLWVGPLPTNRRIIQTCGNRLCVNSGHLAPYVTGSKTHCPQGHAYTEDNVSIDKRYGTRNCKTCKAAAYQRRKAARVLKERNP